MPLYLVTTRLQKTWRHLRAWWRWLWPAWSYASVRRRSRWRGRTV